MTQSAEDTRTANQLFKEWRKTEEVKRTLIRHGIISGDASLAEVLDALRKAIPQDVFSPK